MINTVVDKIMFFCMDEKFFSIGMRLPIFNTLNWNQFPYQTKLTCLKRKKLSFLWRFFKYFVSYKTKKDGNVERKISKLYTANPNYVEFYHLQIVRLNFGRATVFFFI